jgi:hypothetical protein
MYGADIEFFIKKDPTGRVIPACGLVGGEKNNPIKIDDTYAILEDGAAVELNYTPTDTPKALMDRIYASADVINSFTKYTTSKAQEVRIKGIENHKQAMEIGCMPDFDAYADNPQDPRKTPEIDEFKGFRFSGAHLHFSYETHEQVPAFVAARLADVYITLPVLSLAYSLGGDKLMRCILGPRRAKFYGLPGLYRPKPYGMEYRTLSNFIAFDKRFYQTLRTGMHSTTWLLDSTRLDEELPKLMIHMDWAKVREAITTLDIKLIKSCLEHKATSALQ